MLDLFARIRAVLFASLCLCVFTMDSRAEPAQPAANSPVASIGGNAIPYTELQSRVQEKLAQQQSQYDNKYRRLTLAAARTRADTLESELEALVDERVLALEAAARKTTPSALLDAVKAPQITDAAELTFYDSQRDQINQPFETVKAQIKEFLQGQATEEAKQRYRESLRTKYKAVVTWEPLREQVDAIGPQRGPSTAPVTIVEFSDFQCPYCGRLAPVLKQLLDAYPTQVRLVFRNLPLRSIHPRAGKAAEAGACANVQGKFWEMHDAIYAQQSRLGDKALKENAVRIGLDAKQFDECLDSGAGQPAVTADEEAADKLALAGTPSSFVNGRFVDGAMALYKWKLLIDDELGRAARQTSP
jgi:protein-disulfide isomerase